MKFIDAEKMIAEIERRMEICAYEGTRPNQREWEALLSMKNFIASLQQEPRFPQYDNIVDKVFGAGNLEDFEYNEAEMLVALAKEELLKFLHQEQPKGLHFTPLNRLIQKIPSENWNNTVNNYAKKLRDCLIREGYRKDAEVLQGYISYMNGNNVPMATMDEQEQQEVDLEKYIENEINHYGLSLYEASYGTFSASEIDRIMRKFYELGLNARKK